MINAIIEFLLSVTASALANIICRYIDDRMNRK